MRLRSYLLISNAVSFAIIFICLLISYYKMFLSFNETLWLSMITLGAGVLSFVVHFFMIRPVEHSMRLIQQETKRISDGHFQGKVPMIGPTEFQNLAQQFNEMNTKLDESFAQIRSAELARRDLVANISHDLRTPLASIRAFVEALQDDVIQDQDSLERYLNTIRLETQRLNDMINDLFQLSQLEAGVEPFTPEPYYVDNLILETLQSYTLQIEQASLKVDVDLPEILPQIWIVPLQMKRVLANLLSNAIRYSPPAGMLKIEVIQTNASRIKVSITDQGEGISEEEQEKIFERFYRTDKSRNRDRGGAGLGLSIAKSIVEKHKGMIGVESVIPRGSCFWFTMPIYEG
ncbi:MAG: hypothetical protein A2189_05470 [Paenibacillus sp. RIFOXYA1_FULL_44_5]|nr:MAG: hypothetical protein A2189_05470 [Paenibacillus sp. RIFOXYA1_FULL_44_5]